MGDAPAENVNDLVEQTTLDQYGSASDYQGFFGKTVPDFRDRNKSCPRPRFRHEQLENQRDDHYRYLETLAIERRASETSPADGFSSFLHPLATGKELFTLLSLHCKTDYDQLPPEIQERCPFEELISRLKANNYHYAKLVRHLSRMGTLVYIDTEGNPLFRDDRQDHLPIPSTDDVLCFNKPRPPKSSIPTNNYDRLRQVLYGKDYEEGTPHYGYEIPDDEVELREIERTRGRIRGIRKEIFVADTDLANARYKESRPCAVFMESGFRPDTARTLSSEDNISEANLYRFGEYINGRPAFDINKYNRYQSYRRQDRTYDPNSVKAQGIHPMDVVRLVRVRALEVV